MQPDFAFRAVHQTAVTARAVIARNHGTPARRSHLTGSSDDRLVAHGTGGPRDVLAWCIGATCAAQP